METARAERRVLVALRSGPAILTLVQYAAGLTQTQTRETLHELRRRGLVTTRNRRAWLLTEAGEMAAR